MLSASACSFKGLGEHNKVIFCAVTYSLFDCRVNLRCNIIVEPLTIKAPYPRYQLCQEIRDWDGRADIA